MRIVWGGVVAQPSGADHRGRENGWDIDRSDRPKASSVGPKILRNAATPAPVRSSACGCSMIAGISATRRPSMRHAAP
jgi:hypothetical protein